MDTEDVVRALAFARESGLEVAVRGGGHSVAGAALTDGGLVVDLRRMNAVSVDPDARTATVAGGATMSDLDRATERYGLATTGGRVSTTGVAGLTLGGGVGWLDRKLGLACDRLVSELVDELLCGVFVAYIGPQDQARPFIDPLVELRPDAQLILEVPYADLQCMFDDPPGYRNYWSAEHLSALPDEAIDAFAARAFDMIVPSPSQHALLFQGGLAAREGHQWPTPFRGAAWVVHPFGAWSDPADDERGRQWVRDVRRDVERWASGEVYLNFTGDEGLDRVAAGFGPHYPRLARVKAEHDPDNVFHLNHNIAPAPTIPAPR